MMRVVPPARGAYLGAILLEEQTTPDVFNRNTGTRHAAFMSFTDFPEVLQPQGESHAKVMRFFDSCRLVGAVPVLTAECFGGLESFTREQVVDLARLLMDADMPMILRWNHEMNGSWYPWGQQPKRYVDRFREVADIVHETAPTVAMAWTPNQGWGYPWAGCKFHNAALPSADPYEPYYPGDEYVDWVGLSFYHWGERRGANEVPYPAKWANALGFGNAVPNFHDAFAVGHGKPMMIAETSALFDTNDRKGGRATEADIKRAWIQQVYTLPWLQTQLPQLKALFWFNILKFEAEVDGQVDWRVDGNPEVAAIYRQAVAADYFLKAL